MNERSAGGTKNYKQDIKEVVKYYFADFVRKGGTPPPFTDKIFANKIVTDLGGTPPPFTDKTRKVVFDSFPKWDGRRDGGYLRSLVC